MKKQADNIKHRNGLVFFVLCLWLMPAISCTERMNIETDYATPRLVILGSVTTDTAVHIVQISRTSAYFGNEETKIYSDAVVKINGIELLSAGNGMYLTDPAFYGVSGEQYTLDVWVDFDEDGTPEYYTATTTMPAVHVLDSITLAPLQKGTKMVMAHFQDLAGPNYFGAHLYINQLKYSNKLQRYFLNIFGESVAEGQYIRFPVYYLHDEMRWDDPDYPLLVNKGDTITVELDMFSKEYFEFLRTAQLEVEGGNPLFAGPPANVPSNISGGAIGVFGAYTTSRQRCVIPMEMEW